jgi:beta-lactam-binding protein with PASTA domain
VTKKGDATAKSGEIVKQNPKPGKVLAPGTKIKVTLE